MGLRDSLINFLRDLKFFLSIYTWLEMWILIAYGLGATGVMVAIAFALDLPNPFRSIIIWAIILIFSILVPKTLTSITKKE